jgi:Xaa-Pro aminopeptidase
MSHLSNFQALLIENNYDAAIITNKLNQRYLSDFDFDDGVVLVTREESYLLTDSRYVEAARAQVTKEMQVMLPMQGQMTAMQELLHKHACHRVAVEGDSLSYAAFERYRTTFSDAELTGEASAFLKKLRVHKDDGELEAIARAQELTDAAFAHVLKCMTPKMTEIEVALELEFYMRRNGAEGLAFDTIAVSGSNSSRPHGVPRYQTLEKGFLTMDFGARFNGYCSDMTRTVVLGRADADMKKLYQTVLSAQKAALEAAQEGVHCRELDAIARNIIDGAGYKGCFGHSLGHGVGMFIHEAPGLSSAAAEDSVLERGHVVTFEPGIYIEGKYGCRIEDMVAVCNDGSIRNFTKSPKEMIELF